MNGIVFSGGGGRGPYEFGVYKALTETGTKFDVISGTSVGAITAAFIASGMTNTEVEGLWRQMGTFKVLQPRGDVWAFPTWTHLMYTRPLQRFLRKHLDIEAVQASDMQLRVTAVDVNTGELHVFRNEDLTFDHLMASSAIPLLFPMVEMNGHAYWDGGSVANTPIGPAIEAGATDIFTVLLSPMGSKPLPTPRNMWEAITRLSELRLLGNLKEDIKNAEAVNRLVERGLADPSWRHVDFHIISPAEGLGLSTVLNFSAKKAAELIDHGFTDGHRFWEEGGCEHGHHGLEELAQHEHADDIKHRHAHG